MSRQNYGRGAGAHAIRNFQSGEAHEWPVSQTQPPSRRLSLDASLAKPRIEPLGHYKVRSTPSDVVVVADLPGVESTEVFFAVDPGQVTISGEVRPDPDDNGGDPLWQLCREVCRGHYNQTVIIPDCLLVDSWTATFEDRVLRVRIPRAEPH